MRTLMILSSRLTEGHSLALYSHDIFAHMQRERNVSSMMSLFTRALNFLNQALLSFLHLTLRTCLLAPSPNTAHWKLVLQYMNLGRGYKYLLQNSCCIKSWDSILLYVDFFFSFSTCSVYTPNGPASIFQHIASNLIISKKWLKFHIIQPRPDKEIDESKREKFINMITAIIIKTYQRFSRCS